MSRQKVTLEEALENFEAPEDVTLYPNLPDFGAGKIAIEQLEKMEGRLHQARRFLFRMSEVLHSAKGYYKPSDSGVDPEVILEHVDREVVEGGFMLPVLPNKLNEVLTDYYLPFMMVANVNKVYLPRVRGLIGECVFLIGLLCKKICRGVPMDDALRDIYLWKMVALQRGLVKRGFFLGGKVVNNELIFTGLSQRFPFTWIDGSMKGEDEGDTRHKI